MSITLKMAVRDFIALQERTGSLDMSRSAEITSNLQLGTALHQELQHYESLVTEGYEKEVHLSHVLTYEDVSVEVSGRADGIFKDTDPPLIEEIKTTGSIRKLTNSLEQDPRHPYILQAKMYGLLYWYQTKQLPRLRLYIVSAPNPQEREFVDIPFDHEETLVWANTQLKRLHQRYHAEEKRQQKRTVLAAKLKFPYTTKRRGQEDLINLVQNTVAKKAHLMLQAPTGLGKTMGVLFPALKNALANRRQVMYVTPKNAQQRHVMKAVQDIREEGHDIKALMVTAKEKACLKDECICNPKYCEYAKDYYDKLKASNITSQLKEKSFLSPEVFQDFAHLYEVCPFELSLDMAEHVDVIVGDYNYAFAPHSRIERIFGNDDWSFRINLVVDEAHNLYQRGMDYFSPELSRAHLQELQSKLAQHSPYVKRETAGLFAELHDLMAEYHPEAPQKAEVVEIGTAPFVNIHKQLGLVLAAYAEGQDYVSPSDPLVVFYAYLGLFCEVLAMQGERFVHTAKYEEDNFILQITCCDASPELKQCLEQVSSVVAFSATLKPFSFYSRLTGFDEAVPRHELATPFDKDQRKVMLIPQVSTTFRDREMHVDKIADAIDKVVAVKPGNYFVFFPSFSFLEAVYREVQAPGFRRLQQARGMLRHEAEALLHELEDTETPTLLFAVQGGMLSEGIDLPGERIIGAIVVGPALPAYTLERECLRHYYDENYGEGFDYAYTYPAMTRVVQAAGRVIRTTTDKGLIVLMDRRFLSETYSQCMPGDWFEDSVQDLVSQQILNDVSDFWEFHKSAKKSTEKPTELPEPSKGEAKDDASE